MIGTESSIPIGPQRVPQNIREIKMTKGLRLSLFPIIRGSTRFHIKTCAPIIQIRKIVVRYGDSNCTRENITGNDTATIEPTFGI
jgi:hypothetical protein